jgi:hypothetical protein
VYISIHSSTRTRTAVVQLYSCSNRIRIRIRIRPCTQNTVALTKLSLTKSSRRILPVKVHTDNETAIKKKLDATELGIGYTTTFEDQT